MYKPIAPEIKILSVSDLDIDLFESQYPVPHGVTYNTYLIEAASPVIMDAVDGHFAGFWLEKLAETLDDRVPAAIIVQHLEPDHSGSVAEAMKRYPEMKLIVSARAASMLPSFFPDYIEEWQPRIATVTDGQRLELAPGHTLRFFMAPMVHWPEVMLTLDENSGTLFSADAFGTFGTPGFPTEDWAPEAARYYFNICGKYGLQVQNLLRKLAGTEIKRIAPLHGPVLDDNLGHYISLYDTWSAYKPEFSGVLVAHASIYGNTAKAAEALAESLKGSGVDHVEVVDLARCDMSHAVSEAFRHSALALASATYDAGVFPPMAQFLHHLAVKGFRNRHVGLIQNGSWAPTAAATMRSMLEAMKNITVVEPVVTVHTTVTSETLAEVSALAAEIAAKCRG